MQVFGIIMEGRGVRILEFMEERENFRGSLLRF